MDSLKFLGKPAPKIDNLVDKTKSFREWAQIGIEQEIARSIHLEGAIKEAIELLEIPIIELDKKYVSKNGVAILLKETIGERTKQ